MKFQCITKDYYEVRIFEYGANRTYLSFIATQRIICVKKMINNWTIDAYKQKKMWKVCVQCWKIWNAGKFQIWKIVFNSSWVVAI